MSKTSKAEERLVSEGTILVMASATVGRAIVATKAHEGAVISHHFMRVTPHAPLQSGWVYAFLRSPQGRAMMNGSQYASVIRHIEPKHLAALPVPLVSDDVAREFQLRVSAIVSSRNAAAELTQAAERKFSDALGADEPDASDAGFSVKLSELANRRRRFEGAYHSPRVRAVLRSISRSDSLGEIVDRVWWPNRFKRIYGDVGTPYMSADDVFTTNPYYQKKIIVEGKSDLEEFQIQENWIVMARSGQTYGLNGSAKILTEFHKGFFLSDDLIRIAPQAEGARAGFLLTALTHPVLGRPLVIREAYGTSIPHLDPSDVAAIKIARFGEATENGIADLAESAAAKQAEAEKLERELGEDAGRYISEFLLG
ncbi:MAG: hypothetical protein JWR84_1322 [Caulobacter sp.]|nr:hypothetical protein [Caulobacter sp.]